VGVERAISIWRDVVLHESIHWELKLDIEVEVRFFNLTKSMKRI
jgi:hypothetical protein